MTSEEIIERFQEIRKECPFPRRYHTSAQLQMVKLFNDSGMTFKEFYTLVDIPQSSLSWWIRRSRSVGY